MVQSVRDKLSADIIIKQTVSLSPEIVLEANTDIEAWDAVSYTHLDGDRRQRSAVWFSGSGDRPPGPGGRL